ncbi:MAG: hypothetical protein BWX81_00469 [Spirochaetes bacterium ADurb.Bin110]|nr:MAG: hypothetical protein BWX81_00469 [Spirochaetes bacterium ADurb.Bin110]
MHAHRIGRILWAQSERIVPQILTCFDVILIVIGPVELNLFAFVRDGIHARFVDPLGKKITFRIVAPEKAIQMVVHLALERTRVYRNSVELLFEFFDLGRFLRIGKTEFFCLLDGAPTLGLKLAFISSLILRKGCLNLRQKVLVQELCHFCALGVHNAINTKVEVRLIELEKFLQKTFQFFIFLIHVHILS